MKNLFKTIKLILWAMFGVRSSQGRENDMKHTNPLVVIIIGFIFFLCFIFFLYFLAKYASRV